ncbi:G-protein coupled receptor dmsr-1-like [Mytilus edulis]|uniref:G-protein coupled receptors family 1 profile domain-containing protein n=1 Tax=Mytilus edulis TaxID=6550 RepID=A0A8S3Q025_MYTED|nr:unnamed protein product [Mytilus edulis]
MSVTLSNITSIVTSSMNSTERMNTSPVTCRPGDALFTSVNSSSLTPLQVFGVAYAYLHGYISICVCLFGFMANMANIIVLTRKNMISSTNFILTWLAIADLFTMLDYFPFAVHFYILKDVDLPPLFTRGYGWICFLLFHGSFSICCHTIAIWLTIALAIFRFLYIWFPTRGSTLCSLDHAKKVIVVIIVSTIIFTIPNVIANDFDFVNVCEKTINTTNTSTVIYKREKIYKWKLRQENAFFQFNESLNFFVQASLMKIIPCIMLTLLTILLVVAMHRAYKRRMALKNKGKKEDSDKHNEHNRTTLMLLAVVVLFLITELPQGIMTILNIVDIERFYESVYMPLGDLFDITALCNNAINFVLYCTMSTQFRETFRQTFCSCCPKIRPGWRKMGVAHAERNGATVTTTHV